MTDKIDIPQRHQDFCRAVARLCREHEMLRATLTFDPGFEDPWANKISMIWEQGRHGDAAGEIYISSTVDIRTKIDEKQK